MYATPRRVLDIFLFNTWRHFRYIPRGSLALNILAQILRVLFLGSDHRLAAYYLGFVAFIRPARCLYGPCSLLHFALLFYWVFSLDPSGRTLIRRVLTSRLWLSRHSLTRCLHLPVLPSIGVHPYGRYECLTSHVCVCIVSRSYILPKAPQP